MFWLTHNTTHTDRRAPSAAAARRRRAPTAAAPRGHTDALRLALAPLPPFLVASEGIAPDRFALPPAARSCGFLRDGATGAGRQVLALAAKLCLDPDMFVAKSLVSMYGRCGRVEYAQNLFDSMPTPPGTSSLGTPSWPREIQQLTEEHGGRSSWGKRCTARFIETYPRQLYSLITMVSFQGLYVKTTTHCIFWS